MDKTTTLAASAPIARIRTAHSQTAKDGWRLAETTVELTFSPDRYGLEFAREYLEEAQRQAYAAGQAEADRRNAEAH